MSNNAVIGIDSMFDKVKEHFIKRNFPASYYTLHQGVTVGSAVTAIPCAFGIGPTLNTVTTDTAQWTANAERWTGDAATKGLMGSCATEAEYDRVVAVKDGAVLICAQISRIAAPASGQTIISLGYIGTAGYVSHFQLRLLPSMVISAYAMNDNQVEVSNSLVDWDSLTQDTINVYFLIDARNGFKTLQGWWGDITGTRVITGSGSITNLASDAYFSCRPIASGAATPANMRLCLGTKYNSATGVIATPSAVPMRRAMILNFGQNLPSNITEIIQGLNSRNIAPCSELLTI